MNNPPVLFVTICGGGEDYEFLLGAIEYHAELGRHLVLDTTPPGRRRAFRNLPDTVTWVHEPSFGGGKRDFKFVSAFNHALSLAKAFSEDVIAILDCDEFYSPNTKELLSSAARNVVEIQTIHYNSESDARMFGDTEWHRRLWPNRAGVCFTVNQGWLGHKEFNGNKERHPLVDTNSLPVKRVEGLHHHHLHYAIGNKRHEDRDNLKLIGGWDAGGVSVDPASWPAPLIKWKKEGKLPSTRFSSRWLSYFKSFLT